MLKIRQFGDPILRQNAALLSDKEITSPKTKQLLKDIKLLLSKNKYGVALSAPQIGESIALIYVSIKPTPTRPDLDKFKITIINPKIKKVYGHRKQLWEGCCSLPDVYAKVPRYKKILIEYQSPDKKTHKQFFKDFQAQVLQHEIDHLNGILYVDKIRDLKTIITAKEYRIMVRAEAKVRRSKVR